MVAVTGIIAKATQAQFYCGFIEVGSYLLHVLYIRGVI